MSKLVDFNVCVYFLHCFAGGAASSMLDISAVSNQLGSQMFSKSPPVNFQFDQQYLPPSTANFLPGQSDYRDEDFCGSYPSGKVFGLCW